ncbi:uncharacterized protein B0H18DRAFT_1010269 [Fomitopsis serialis]|uniref:uncharacterized protein n=1 Tax=Fomitopsis serialis TaxID=139415 RepID=UPI0020084E1E|nr:uncharacterized protein B0H18DRAFT_1010269 [Neoantrodia serialis]KAH9925182.1 hypothetical protein B0H18DRAFT_1010269 [Neoantrodia serialis]
MCGNHRDTCMKEVLVRLSQLCALQVQQCRGIDQLLRRYLSPMHPAADSRPLACVDNVMTVVYPVPHGYEGKYAGVRHVVIFCPRTPNVECWLCRAPEVKNPTAFPLASGPTSCPLVGGTGGRVRELAARTAIFYNECTSNFNANLLTTAVDVRVPLGTDYMPRTAYNPEKVADGSVHLSNHEVTARSLKTSSPPRTRSITA